MLDRISRSRFTSQKSHNVALSKAADLAADMSDLGPNRTAPFVISTGAVDRDGDTLAVDGWDLADYEKNPIILFDHDPKSPIGTSLSTFVKGGALRAVAFFPTRDVSELSDDIYKLIDAKILRTASVTFQPVEFSPAVERANQSPWGMPPMDFTKQKLLEWSVVSVPSNQDALYEGKSLAVDWRAYQQHMERALDGEAPLAAPRVEYEKTHAIVKGFLSSARRGASKAKPSVMTAGGREIGRPTTEPKPMATSKAGKVLNKDNTNRLKAAMKHAEKADELHGKACDMHEKALDLHEKCKSHNEKCMEHMKAIMDSHVDGEDDPSNTGEGKKTGAEESQGEEEDVTGQGSDKPGHAGDTTVSGEGEAEDYYELYSEGKLPKSHDGDEDEDDDDEEDDKKGKKGKKDKDDEEDREKKSLARRARAAISRSVVGGAAKSKSLLDEEVSDEELSDAFRSVIDREIDKLVREQRGQD